MIKTIHKYVGFITLAYILICLFTPFNKILLNRSIENQINYLAKIMDRGYDDKLQRRFPEGKLFSNSILALSTIEYSDRYNKTTEKYANIVDNCIKRIQSERTLGIFSPTIEPQYGMFFNGWSNYVYSTYRKSKLFKLSELQEKVKEQSTLIESRIESVQKDSIRILDTYIESNWPADNLIGIISLDNDQLRNDWIKHILDNTKHQSGLIHHSGSDRSQVRGSSSAMITFCLSKSNYLDIDNYNKKFQNTFSDNYLGIQLIKENENGSNEMDVDSGPVVFGYGASATIMNIKTQASLDNPRSKFTWAAMNLVSVPINIFRKKYFLMKKEPMLDLFMLWGSTELK